MKKVVKRKPVRRKLPKARLNYLALIFGFIFLTGIVVYVFLNNYHKIPVAATRDPLKQPFASDSPWNMPIGSNAVYTKVTIPHADGQLIENELVIMSPDAPLRTMYAAGSFSNDAVWWPGAACNTNMQNRGQFPIPDGYVVPPPPAGDDDQWGNRAGGVLKSDKRTIQEFQYATRCSSTGPLTAGSFRTTYDIYGSGIPVGPYPNGYGAHGGSGLSGVGGSLRKWEVDGTDPIRHALKMTVSPKTLSKCNSGFRWPAIWADGGFDQPGNSEYRGSVCDYRMGSLVAIPPSYNCGQFSGLSGRICTTLQDYGAYIVDIHPNSEWVTIIGEWGTSTALINAKNDIFTMVDQLNVIANNGPTSIGGGGNPRQPLLPELCPTTGCGTTAFNTVDQVIATRGSNLLHHDINIPSPMSTWAWGQHGTESARSKQADSGSVAPWLVMFRDASTINSATNARFNVRRLALYNYQPSNGQWVKLFDGLPQWRVYSNPDTTSGYTDIAPTTESDGSYSFAIPAGMVLHMAAGPWPTITEGNGVLAIVEARLLGSAGDIAAAKAAVAAGSDYRAAGGGFSQGMSTPGYHEAGFGHFGLLTGEWKAYDMLSSTLTDTQFRANYPAELNTATVVTSPTPTPPQATTQPVLPSPPLNSFRADYFNNQTLTGTPVYSANTTSVNYNWGSGSPATGVSADHFSAKYTGSFSFDGSTYKFNATSDDGVRVYLDGQVIIDAWKDQGPTTYSVSKTPSVGNHTVTVEYYENGYGATLAVNWAKTQTVVADTDKDGFSDTVEAYVGTDSNKTCGVNAWPPDIDNDGAVSSLDLTRMASGYGTRVGDLKYNKRYDLDADGTIAIPDLNILGSYFTQRCTNPVMVPVASRPDVNQFIASMSKIIEAETFKLNSGYLDPAKNIFSDAAASGGKGFILWSAGSAQTTTTSGFGKATLRVRADVCDGGPKLTLKIDGKSLYSQSFSSTGWTDITVDFAAAAGTNHTIRVELASDRYRAGVCDRNLRFDKVTLL